MLRYLTLCALVFSIGCGSDDDDPADMAAVDVLLPDVQPISDANPQDMGSPTPDMAAADVAIPDMAIPDMAPDAAPLPMLRAMGRNERDVDFDWIAAGQPTEARVREIVAAGVPIIDLRYPQEDPFDEPGLVESLGGQFTRYPTSGMDYERVEFREGMYDLYDAAIANGGTVYLHCASSNRVGASWAFYHAERLGLEIEAALAKGREAGLRSLEDTVRRILEN